jgi:hypothetical protein
MNKQDKLFLLVVVLFFSSFKGSAQKIADTIPASGFLFQFSYAGQLPGADLAKRFGFTSNVGGAILYKTKSNLQLGGEFNYFFGNVLRETRILDSIATTSGNLIVNDGNFPGVTYFERGFDIQLTAGKLFPISKNLNSGVLVSFSAGYIQHHIDIEIPSDWTPQVSGDYLQGYDRLTAGVCITEFVGYQYISKKLFLSMFGGFEFTQGFTKSLRYDFDLQAKNTNLRYDLLNGIRIGWMLPLLQEHKLKFYTY